MRGLFPKKKSRLSPQGNAIAAAHVLLDSAEGRLDEGRRQALARGSVPNCPT